MAVIWKGVEGEGTPIVKFGVSASTLQRAKVEAEALGQLTDKGDPSPRFLEACLDRGVASFASKRQELEMAARLAALEQRVEGIAQKIEEGGA